MKNAKVFCNWKLKTERDEFIIFQICDKMLSNVENNQELMTFIIFFNKHLCSLQNMI